MKFNAVKATLIASTIALTSGCASIMTDDIASLNVKTSSGKQAKVTLDNQEYTVPGVILVQKEGRDLIFNTQANNCQNTTVVKREIEPWFWGDVVLLSPLSTVVDYFSESMWTYDETVVINCGS